MFIILARHGNTFDEDQTPFYVGGRTDLPLTQTGSQQAVDIADAIDKSGIAPACIYVSGLKRTQQTMLPTVQRLEVGNVKIDKRLNEMDYGKWEAKTNAEVDALYDGWDGPRRAWDKDGTRPDDAGFAPSEDEIKNNIKSLVEEIISNYDDDKIVMICTSNGILRYFLHLIPGAYEAVKKKGALKVKTGHVCGINVGGSMKPDVYFWNEKPSEAPFEDF